MEVDDDTATPTLVPQDILTMLLGQGVFHQTARTAGRLGSAGSSHDGVVAELSVGAHGVHERNLGRIARLESHKSGGKGHERLLRASTLAILPACPPPYISEGTLSTAYPITA